MLSFSHFRGLKKMSLKTVFFKKRSSGENRDATPKDIEIAFKTPFRFE